MKSKRYISWLISHDYMKRRNTWMSLPQSTGSLTTNTALTASEETSYLGTVFMGWTLLSNTWLAVHFLYSDRGSMFSKRDAYSSRETTFLPRIINQAQWNVKKSSKLRYSKMIETLQGSYLKPYSDITTAGSPFPAAIINWFSYLMGKKEARFTIAAKSER